MTLQEAVELLRKELEELPLNSIEFNLGYGAAIRDLEHIANEQEHKED